MGGVGIAKRRCCTARKLLLVTAMAALAACSSRPPPTPPPLREQVREIELDDNGLACIDEAPELVVAHHEPAPMYGASSCDTRPLEYGALFGLAGSVVAMGMAASCAGPQDGLYVDVAAKVRDEFVLRLPPAKVASDLETPVACPAGDSIVALQQAFGDKPVLDFKTTDWQKAKSGLAAVYVPSTIRGRLVDLKGGRVLWEDACPVAPQQEADNLNRLRDELEVAATACARRFSEEFARVRPAD